jgi:hypothetical protein
MQITRFKIQYLPATILIVVGVLVWVLSLASVATAGTYAESGHGNTSYGVNRAGTECPPDTPCPTGDCAHCHDTFDELICGVKPLMLFEVDDPDSQTDNFCFQCHKGTGSVQVGGIANYTYSTNFGGGDPTFTTIYDAFNTATGSSHNLADVLNHVVRVGSDLGYTYDTNACLACHDAHLAQQNCPVTDSGMGGVYTAVRHPAHYGYHPRNLWGDEDFASSGFSERIKDYVPNNYQAPYYGDTSGTKYEPSGNASPSDGSDLPNYKYFCTYGCHYRADVWSAERGANLKSVDWANHYHGESHQGGTTGGASIDPYSNPGFNYVLCCTDCHEPHGSENEWLLRTWVNGTEVSVPGPGRYWYFCQACHTLNQHFQPFDDTKVCSGCHNHSYGGSMF